MIWGYFVGFGMFRSKKISIFCSNLSTRPDKCCVLAIAAKILKIVNIAVFRGYGLKLEL